MVICGVNVTHDGCVSVISDNRLVFSTEVEKIANGRRYSVLGELERISGILRSENLAPRDIDQYVINGWYAEPGIISPHVRVRGNGTQLHLPVAPYIEQAQSTGALSRYVFDGVPDTCLADGYSSFPHVATHVIGAYCTSPFAKSSADALVLVWDGGMLPRLYSVTPTTNEIRFLCPLFPFIGNLFVEFCLALEPFRYTSTNPTDQEPAQAVLEVPGKAMAYAALGTVNPAIFPTIGTLLNQLGDAGLELNCGRSIGEQTQKLFPDMSGADLIATFQAYIGQLLVSSLSRILQRRFKSTYPRLCLSGGCALNIKWNTLLRKSGMFSEIWIPPFPNDSGAALGAACCEMSIGRPWCALEWDVYSGPQLDRTRVPRDWPVRPCDARQLATVLHETGEPVTVLNGRAELGPRSLGNRSILAPAIHSAMKDRLNSIKGRASYRPVAPICLESCAAEVFDPGGRDQYMLFEHQLRNGWNHRIPAIMHLDGSARLQTISPSTAGTVAGRVLNEYWKLTGIPVLCNTSANLSGSGFFQDPASAADWGGTRHVWADGLLYTAPRGLGDVERAGS